MIELCKRACKGCTSDGTLCRQFAYLLDKWISVEKELPKEDGEVRITLEVKLSGETRTCVDFAYFSKDLCEADDREFQDKKGISGFYKYDTEWGDNYETYPIAWQPLPEPYKEVTK